MKHLLLAGTNDLSSLQVISLWCQLDNQKSSPSLDSRLVSYIMTTHILNPSVESDLSSWAMICIACIIYRNPTLSVPEELWTACTQKIHNKDTSSAACFCINTMITRHKNLPIRLESVLGMFDSYSPLLSTGSFQLCSTLLKQYATKMTVRASLLAKRRLLDWLLHNWRTDIKLMKQMDSYGSLHGIIFASLEISNCLATFFGFSLIESDTNYVGPLAEACYIEASTEGPWDHLYQVVSGGEEELNREVRRENHNANQVYNTELVLEILDTFIMTFRDVNQLLKEINSKTEQRATPVPEFSSTLHILLLGTIIVGKLNKIGEDDKPVDHYRKVLNLCTLIEELSNAFSLWSAELPTYEANAICLHLSGKVLCSIRDNYTTKRTQAVFRLSSKSIHLSLLSYITKVNFKTHNFLHSISAMQSSREIDMLQVSSVLDLIKSGSLKSSSTFASLNQLVAHLTAEDLYNRTELFFLCASDYWCLFIKEYSGAMLSRDYILLLRYVGSKLLASRAWKLSEVTMRCCIKLLLLGCHQCFNEATKNIHQEAVTHWNDIFKFIRRVIFESPVNSPAIRLLFCELLCLVIQKFSTGEKIVLDSKQCLVRVLYEGNGAFVYHITFILVNLLSSLSHKDRLSLYYVIMEGLGPVIVDVPNICFRSNILSSLAEVDGDLMILAICDLLRLVAVEGPSSQHIFVKHAVKHISEFYGLTSCRELFYVIADPVFDFWIKIVQEIQQDNFGEPFKSFPYDIFGFATEKDFMESNLTHICSRVIMLGNDVGAANYLERFKATTGIPLKNIYYASVYKSVSYGLTILDIPINDLCDAISKRINVDCNIQEVINDQMVDILGDLLSTVDVSDYTIEFPSSSVLGPLNNKMPEIATSIARTGLGTEKVLEFIDLMTEGDIWKLNGETGANTVGILRRIFSIHGKYYSDNEKHLSLRRCLFLLSILQREPSNIRIAARRRSPQRGENNAVRGYTLELCLRGTLRLISVPQIENEACLTVRILISQAPRHLLIELGFVVLQNCLHYTEQELSDEMKNLLVEISISLVNCVEFWEADILAKSINYLLRKDNALFSNDDVMRIITGENGQVYFPHVRKCCWDILSCQLESENYQHFLLNETGSILFEHVPAKLLSNMRDYYPKSKNFITWSSRIIGRSFLADDTLSLTSPESKVFDSNISAEDDLFSWYQDDPIFCSIIQIIRRILQNGDFLQFEYVERCLCLFQQNITADRRPLLDCLPEWLLDGTNNTPPDPYIVKKREISLSVKDPGESFLTWVQNLSMSLLSIIKQSNPIFEGLEKLVENIPDLSSELFPILVHQLLTTTEGKEASGNISPIFDYYFPAALDGSDSDLKVLELLVDTVLYLRMFNLVDSPAFQVNWQGCAMAAARLGRYKTALMFLEIHWNNSRSVDLRFVALVSRNIRYPDMHDAIPAEPSLQSSVESSVLSSASHNDLLYSMIFESAVRNAIESGYTSDNSDQHSKLVLADSFSKTGIYSIADMIFQSDSSNRASDYSPSWKLEKWNLPDIEHPRTKDELIYQLYKGLNVDPTNPDIFPHIYERILSSMLMENQPQYGELFQLLGIVTEAEEVYNIADESKILQILTSQRERTAKWVNYDGFDKVEDILITRQINWRLLQQRYLQDLNIPKSALDDVASAFTCSFIDHCHLALEDENVLKGMNSVVKFLYSKLPELNETIKIASTIESASVCWASGHQSTSIAMLKSVISLDSFRNAPPQASYFFSRSNVYAKLANWLSLAKHEADQTIVAEYLDPALQYRKSDSICNPLEGKTELYHVFASFCDEKFRSESLNREMTIQFRQRKDKERRLAELKKLRATTKDSKILKSRLERLRKSHDNQYQILKATSQNFLFKSIKHYLHSICHGDEYGGDVSRFLDLWFANATNPTYIAHLNQIVANFKERIPSIKLVPWISQLSSKLTLETNEFQETLWNIVGKVCEDHPYHTLYHIVALKLSSKYEERCAVGAKFFDRLSSRKKVDAILLYNFEALALKTIESAKMSPPKYANGQIASKMLLDRMGDTGSWWLKTLPTLLMPIPTAEVELRADGKYLIENLPVVYKILRQITIASGINHPKIISIVDNRGTTSLALIKGGDRDDLRQDAVMEQVFDQVNRFFRKDRKTRIRNLRVRTYKIVPLGPGGGIIEFVRNTSPFITIAQELHSKYNPNDMDADTARREMLKVETESQELRIRAYKYIERKLQPAFRFFFLERFFSPEEWFHNRTLYSRSTAVNSIIGYILGLGDRHCSNILVDTLTGEIIHIDLGIAFDQGKLLPIPETVPFRLTRDIVDGMGISGVSGVFQKSCEITLLVLREEIEAITTILNVLRYDPLYTWTMSDKKKKELQGGWQDSALTDDAEIGTEAGAAIAGVRNKLSTKLSAEATVREQIQEASDSKNLAVIFRGWAPFY